MKLYLFLLFTLIAGFSKSSELKADAKKFDSSLKNIEKENSLDSQIKESLQGYNIRANFKEFIDQNFIEPDRQKMPPEGGIVITGSSSIRMWNSAQKDLAPLTIIRRGFGGSRYIDLLYYADELILKYKPRAVVVYTGSNNFKNKKATVKGVFNNLELIIKKIHQSNIQTRVYVCLAKPTLVNMESGIWEKLKELNKMVIHACENTNNLDYIDMVNALQLKEGHLQENIFLKDRIHLNENGYKLWSAAFREKLFKTELEFEDAK